MCYFRDISCFRLLLFNAIYVHIIPYYGLFLCFYILVSGLPKTRYKNKNKNKNNFILNRIFKITNTSCQLFIDEMIYTLYTNIYRLHTHLESSDSCS